MTTNQDYEDLRAPTGSEGLDRILAGGYPRGRLILIEGEPGTGKTTLATQFLISGAARGETALFLSIAQSESELQLIARSHGLDLSGVHVFSPSFGQGAGGQSFSVSTNEMQMVELMEAVYAKLAEVSPTLFVFDSLLELRLLASSEVVYRRETLSLRHGLQHLGTTSLLLDHLQPEGSERHAEGIAHGVVRLDSVTPPVGIIHRRLNVIKMRGSTYLEGLHDFRIGTGGLEIFPRAVPPNTTAETDFPTLATPLETLNRMLGGGLEFGTNTLIVGQSGTGKSTLATVFADAAAAEGRKAALFLFEERIEVFRQRSKNIGLTTAMHEGNRYLSIRHFHPAETSPGEFAHNVIAAVEVWGAQVVVIDSLSGYLSALPDREYLITHLQTLMQYLTRRGALVIVTLAQHGLLGEPPRSELDLSYLADTIVLLRQYATGSAIRRSIAILKKRQSPHDRQVQELLIEPGSVDVVPISEDMAFGMRDKAQLGTG